MKKMIVIICASLLLTGCASNSMNESSHEKTGSKFFNVKTSHFDSYTNEQTDTAYIITGRVTQENDGNAIAVNIHAEESGMVNVRGTLTKISGNNTELVYVSEDGEKVKIADNSSASYDTAISIPKGEGKIIFMGESAVYDFELELELTEGVSCCDL